MNPVNKTQELSELKARREIYQVELRKQAVEEMINSKRFRLNDLKQGPETPMAYENLSAEFVSENFMEPRAYVFVLCYSTVISLMRPRLS
jgi:hypothetical protein